MYVKRRVKFFNIYISKHLKNRFVKKIIIDNLILHYILKLCYIDWSTRLRDLRVPNERMDGRMDGSIISRPFYWDRVKTYFSIRIVCQNSRITTLHILSHFRFLYEIEI